MNLTLREATPDDAQALLDFVEELAHEPDIDIPLEPGEFGLTVEQERALLADLQRSPTSIMILAFDAEHLIGNLLMQGYARRRIRHVARLSMAVRQGYRGQGIGRRLMEDAMAWVHAGGVIKRVELVTYARNAPAQALYRAFGFNDEGVRRRAVFQNGEWIDDLAMALILP